MVRRRPHPEFEDGRCIAAGVGTSSAATRSAAARSPARSPWGCASSTSAHRAHPDGAARLEDAQREAPRTVGTAEPRTGRCTRRSGSPRADEIDRLGIIASPSASRASARWRAARGGSRARGQRRAARRHARLAEPGAGDAGCGCTTRVKADRDCASVAAASVIAKVHRDRLMIEARRRPPRSTAGREQGLRRAPRTSRRSPQLGRERLTGAPGCTQRPLEMRRSTLSDLRRRMTADG